MSEWDMCHIDTISTALKEQAVYYISKIYMQGYKDAIYDLEKEQHNV